MKKTALFVLPFITALSLNASSLNNDPFFQDPFGDDIFKEMMQMQKQMDKMFEQMHQRMQKRASGMLAPIGSFKLTQPSQLEDKGDHYEFVTAIPQSDENHIDINTKNGMLSITAKIVKENKQQQKGMTSISKSVQMYQEAIPLPKDADTNAIATEYKNNHLVISIKKKAVVKVKPNTVRINGVEQPIKIDKKQEEAKDKKKDSK